MVFPVLLGSGKRLFADDAAGKTPLRLVDATTLGVGVELLTYRPG